MEDRQTDPKQLVDIYSWLYIAGLLTAFVSPITGLLIQTFSLVPTVRGLYLFASVMMAIKSFSTNAMVTETEHGLQRMRETKHQSILANLGEYRGVFRTILKSPGTLYTLGIMLVMSSCTTISNTFWAILVTSRLHIPAQDLAYYAFARTGIMLVFFFVAMLAIREMHFKRPMLFGFAGYILSLLILVTIPEKNYFLLLVSTLLEACSYATVSPQVDRMVAVTIDPRQAGPYPGHYLHARRHPDHPVWVDRRGAVTDQPGAAFSDQHGLFCHRGGAGLPGRQTSPTRTRPAALCGIIRPGHPDRCARAAYPPRPHTGACRSFAAPAGRRNYPGGFPP